MNKLLVLLLALGATALVQADSPAPANEAMCRACHGVGGATPLAPGYPKLAGQNKEYIINALKAYKSGERKSGLAAVMGAQASALSEADMEAFAAYYSAQK